MEQTQQPWVVSETVGSVLRRTARDFGSHDAVVFPSLGLRWSWGELDRRVDRIASALVARGVKPGEHVGIWSMNAPEWVVAQFAVGRIGAVLVNINPAYRSHELEQALFAADVATLIVGSPFKGSNFVEMVNALCPEVASTSSFGWTSDRLPRLRRLITLDDRPGVGWIGWAELEDGERHVTTPGCEHVAHPDAIYNIQFTSGTTGLPKGAMLTHRNVLLNAFYVGQRLRYAPADRVCVPVPFYHCFGCVLGTLVCAVYASALVVPSASFDAGATLAAIEAERCTSIYGVPTMFAAELDHPDRPSRDLSSLRTGIMAGSPCPLPLMTAVVETMGATQMTIGYGQTEASPIITQTSVDDPLEVRVGTVGRPIPGLDVRLFGVTGREEVHAGQVGELCVRGHAVMAGYYRAPEATARAIDTDGWLHTGDLARRREDGNYRIVGRSKELVIRGGENIYPPEVEEFLHHHPAVSEVAVLGLPDAKFGEVVAVWVVPRPGTAILEAEIREYCQGKIAHFKIPQYIRIVDQLPKTVTGKIRKQVLREEGIEHYGLTTPASIPTA
ncbi:AMP-binding protein [Singulisphaera rosea]